MTEKTKMTITRALTELKGTSAKIDSVISTGVFVQLALGEKARTADSLKEKNAQVQSSFDRFDGLLARRNAIKAKIIASNAATQIEFRGTKMSVAEAIELRTNTLEFKKKLLQALISQHYRVTTEKAQAETKLNELVSRMEAQMFSREGDSASRAEELLILQRHQEKVHGCEVIDPAGILKRIEDLRTEITDFDVELDALLSESNAVTVIEL